MIEFVDTVGKVGSSFDTALICTDSVFLQDYIISKLKKNLGVMNDYCISVGSAGELKQARANALAAPIEGKKWLVIIDMNKVGIDVYKKEARRVNDNSFTLLTTSKYGVFKRLSNDNELKRLKFLLPYYFGSFAKDDITYISTGYDMTAELVSFLEKNYRWDVNKVMTLFHMLKQGTRIDNKRDVIDLIGNGGVTPASVVFEMLMATPDTPRKAKALTKTIVGHINDLSRKMTYRALYQQMYSTLLGVMDVKELRINGNYMGLFKEIPEGYDTKRISRVKRFLWQIDSIPTNRVLSLLSQFKTELGYGKEAEV